MNANPFSFIRRIKNWINKTEYRLHELETEIQSLRVRNEDLKDKLRRDHDDFAIACRILLNTSSPSHHLFSFILSARQVYCVYRGTSLHFIYVTKDVPIPAWCGSLSVDDLFDLVSKGTVRQTFVRMLRPDGRLDVSEEKPELHQSLHDHLDEWRVVFTVIGLGQPTNPPANLSEDQAANAKVFFNEVFSQIEDEPDLIDSLALGKATILPGFAGTDTHLPPPFDHAHSLPPAFPAQPKSRSVLFLHNSYYHFNTLANALKRRGWDAVTVSIESPDSPQQQFYFGEDINLYHDDPKVRQQQIADFFGRIPERFGALHFYGRGRPSFFEENFHNNDFCTQVPWDFLELRRHRTIIGYMPSGCLDGVSQTAIKGISSNVCARCVWEQRPDICGDARNRAWGDILDRLCDWIGIEGDWGVEDRIGRKFVRGPVVTTLDPDYWTPDLDIPEDMLIPRQPEDILVYAAVGNLTERRKDGRDIKGLTAIETAVETLQNEGFPIKFMLQSKIPIGDVRYYKVQADIVVDQLNYGRLGANARESFMLGKPVITRLNPVQQSPLPPVRSVAEAPAQNASEETIEDVLRDLALDPEKRVELSKRSRDYALAWFADYVCAHRFETIIDRVAGGLPPETDSLYPERHETMVTASRSRSFFETNS